VNRNILLGFEVGTGKPVEIRLHHLAVFGMTALSGKTTTLEALISRSGLRAIAFITKRGESGFTSYRLIPPYYKQRADWQYIEGLVNVALGEKVKYEPGMRWAIIKVAKESRDLRDVRRRAVELKKKARREFVKQTLEKLIAYLDIVIPELERFSFSDRLELEDGVNVMDLHEMPTEIQQLVIASTIEYVFRNLNDTVVIIPEAWEMLPQFKMTPVKWVAQQLIRKGAAVGNFIFLDSQDIGGIDKTPLRQVDNWLIGRNRVVKAYVLPAGVPEEVGRKVALGQLTPEYVRDTYLKPRILEGEEEMKYKLLYEEEKRKREELEKKFKKAMTKLEELKKQWNVEEYQKTIAELKDEVARLKQKVAAQEKTIEELEDAEEVVGLLRTALSKIMPQQAIVVESAPTPQLPGEINVKVEQPVITVEINRKPLELSQHNLEGRIAIVYAEGLLPDKAFSISQLNKILESRFGTKEFPGNLGPACNKFVSWGYFEKVQSGKRWDYRVKLRPEEAKNKGLLKISGGE